MADREMKTKITLDGEKEYSAALKSINAEAKLSTSSLSRLKAEYDGQLNSLDYLEQKQKAVSHAYDLATEKVKTIQGALKNAEQIQSEYGEKVDSTKAAISKLEEEMSKLDTSTEAGATAYEEMAQQLAELNDDLKNNEKYYAASGDAVQNWTTQLNSAYVSKKRLGQQLNSTNKYLDEAQKASDGCATSIDGLGKKVKQAADDTEEMAGDLQKAESAMESTSAATIAVGNLMAEAIQATAEKAKELAETLVTAGVEYQQSQSKMAAATGATGDELERLNSVAQSVFSQGLGDSMDDAYNGVTAVKNATGLMDNELQKAVESGFALRDTFGFELQESARTAQALMKNFGISAEESYNIIAIGAQNGANKNGDLLDILNEYGAQYAALGLDADQFIQSLISGAEAGVFSIDKVGDAVKEFNIRAKDGSTTSQEAFELLGMSADQMTAKFAAGGDSAKNAMFEVVAALQSMEDPVKKNAAAVGLFGTMYEDLEANLLPILASMEDASGATYDAMGQINKIRYSDLQTQWERIKRQIVVGTLPQLQTALDKVGDTLEDPRMTESVDEIGESLGDLAETGGEVAEKVLPVLADGLDLFIDVADVALDRLPELIATMVIYKGTAVAMDIAQQGLNATLNLNPYAAVAGLLAGIVTALGKAVIEANSMDEATKDLNESLRVTQERAANERDEIEANETAALNLVNQIQNLSAKENKSAQEKQKLAGLVSTLNELVPNLGASYDQLSDSINMSTTEMRNFILQSAKLQAVESMQGELADLYVDQAKALDNYIDKKNAAIQSERDYNRAIRDLNHQLEDGLIDQQMYDSALSVAKTEMELAAGAAEDAKGAYDAISEAVTTTEEDLLDYADASSESAETTEADTEAKIENAEAAELAAEANEEFVESVKEMTDVLSDAGIAADGLAEKLVEQGLTASDVESKIESYKDTTCDAFQKIEEEQDISVEKMIETLEHNAEVTKAWSEDLAILYASAGDDATKSFLSYMEGLGPAYAPILEQLTADTSGTLLAELVAAWSAGSSAAVEAALIAMGVLPEQAAAIAANAAQQSGEQFAADTEAYSQAGTDAQTAYVTALSEITPAASEVLLSLQGEIETRLSEIKTKMSTDGTTAGSDMMTKMRGGIRGSQGKVTTRANEAAQAAYEKINDKDWSGLGYNLSAGVAQGISSGSYLITNAANAAVDAALASAKERAGVASPAKAWDEELGYFLPGGAAKGVERGTPELLKQVRSTMDRALETAREAAAGAYGVGMYDFVPSMDTIARHETINNYSTSVYNNAAAGSLGGTGETERLLGAILQELQSTGGMTANQVAKVLTPLINTNLGTALRREERGY